MATPEGFSFPFFPSSVNILTWVANFFMYGVVEKLKSGEFVCDMCKSDHYHQKRYSYKTFEVLPKTPSKDLVICEKCAIREFGSKNKNKFKEMFGK